MAEYIKREALIAEIEENINTYWNEDGGGYYLAEDALKYSVKTAPTADVVEVVRCKDCKYAKPVIHRGEVMEDLFKCTYIKMSTELFDIDYCRYGRPKERGDKQ